MPRNWKEKFKDGMLWALPTLNAFYEAAVVAMAVTDTANDKSYSDALRFSLLITATGFAFIQSMALNGKSTVDGVKETSAMLRTRKYPETEEWPKLARSKEILCLSTTAVITLAVLNADFFSGFFFVDEVPDDYQFASEINLSGWKAFAITAGVIAASTTAFTECISLLKAMRSVLAGQRTQYANALAKYATRFFGNTIAILGGLENVIEANSSMKKILHPTSRAQQYGLLVICTSKLFSDYNFSGRNCKDGIKAFTERLSQGNIKGTEVVAFTITAGTAVLVVFAQPYLTADLMNNQKTSPPFSTPLWLTDLLGWGVTARDGIVQIYMLYKFALRRVEALNTKLHTAYNRMKECAYGSTPLLPLTQPLLIEEDAASLSPYKEGNINMLFSPSRNLSIRIENPESPSYDPNTSSLDSLSLRSAS